MHFQPIPREELRRLREELSFTNSQMAELFGVSTSGQFHKYTSDKERREMGFHVLMYGMLGLALLRGMHITNVEQLHDLARSYGAVIDMAPGGEPQQ
ncbi:hypothetical protein LFL96_21295 [Paraburkholderia sp. D15]|uniref:hypothetical protein n=1 Tax=Paraburkholderia sp. D15 TaxID=2880218 RepID=UPI00247B1DE8|nr:hypothetical protein [Paraburkholderia sp. D15]WGS53596.1 hypothetical protein LFL96_21295 [Paraburkholderia sp. D15]